MICQICSNDYGGLVIPMQMHCCGQHLCEDCAEGYRAAKAAKLKSNRVMVKCLFCGQNYHSFRGKPWSLNRGMIEALGITVDVRPAARVSLTTITTPSPPNTNSPPIRSLRRRQAALAPAADIRPVAREGLPNSHNSPTSSSSSLRHRAASSPPIRRVDPTETEGDESLDSTSNRGRKKSRVGSSNRLATPGHPRTGDERDWFSSAQLEGIRVFRIRQFRSRAVCKDTDPCGRRPALWDLKTGSVLNEADYLPMDRFPSGSSFSSASIAKFCAEERPADNEKTIQRNNDTKFAGMAKGNIVALNIPSKHKGMHEACFGVVQDDVVRVENTSNLEINEGFPTPPDFHNIKRLLVRKVSWKRRALFTDLRSADEKYCNWLRESNPIFLFDITEAALGENGNDNKMTTQNFLDVSSCDLQDLIDAL